MELRSNRLQRLCRDIGTDVVSVVDAMNGWPGLVRSETRIDQQLITLHVSSVGSHARKEYELRFQNPGQNKPVRSIDGSYPLLLGDAEGVLILVDGSTRLGRNTRFSILFSTEVVHEARRKGWSVYTSNTGEVIYAFLPIFFDLAVSSILDGNLNFESNEVESIYDASGYADNANDETRERIRRNVSSIVRSSSFSGNVRKAYENKCAMCGINCNVIVGAHIYPASAPGARDIVVNGLALCQNHHTMFDNHQIYVAPDTRKVVFHPDIITESQISPITKNFIDNTYERLAPAREEASSPDKAMFESRYRYFSGKYDWLEE